MENRSQPEDGTHFRCYTVTTCHGKRVLGRKVAVCNDQIDGLEKKIEKKTQWRSCGGRKVYRDTHKFIANPSNIGKKQMKLIYRAGAEKRQEPARLAASPSPPRPAAAT